MNICYKIAKIKQFYQWFILGVDTVFIPFLIEFTSCHYYTCLRISISNVFCILYRVHHNLKHLHIVAYDKWFVTELFTKSGGFFWFWFIDWLIAQHPASNISAIFYMMIFGFGNVPLIALKMWNEVSILVMQNLTNHLL